VQRCLLTTAAGGSGAAAWVLLQKSLHTAVPERKLFFCLSIAGYQASVWQADQVHLGSCKQASAAINSCEVSKAMTCCQQLLLADLCKALLLTPVKKLIDNVAMLLLHDPAARSQPLLLA
jgi:hypothetical protein